METSSPYRPRVSRETRLLLTAGLMAVAALWLLARIRFPERPVTPNPVPSVLSQLASVPKYDDLAGEIAQLQARLQPSLLALDVPSAVGSLQTSPRTAAIRLRDDLAVTLVPPESSRERWNDAPILARDAASGLAVVHVPIPLSSSPPVPWTPRQPQQPRYFVASDISPAGVSLRPAFVGSLDPIDSPLWSEPLWAAPERTDLAAGSFLFTNDAELAGLVITYRRGLAIVPGATVLAEAERLLAAPPSPPGAIGIEVQDLTPPVASVTAASVGVVVAWVDPDGASSGQLMVGDVIEAVDGRALATRQHWDVRVARLSVGETLSLRVRRRGEIREVALVANAPAAQPASRSLGLTLRARTKIGAEVVRIERWSAADRAGLNLGDIITLVADVSAPTPTQVMRSYTSMGQGDRVIVAVTRGDTHFVTTFER
ncbi:MAG TPA: PDZ domain-containing protein [Vicinamibacterales bacterium]|nr:PDZ domain-containing protein [Vicinamibacterales bacterium]